MAPDNTNRRSNASISCSSVSRPIGQRWLSRQCACTRCVHDLDHDRIDIAHALYNLGCWFQGRKRLAQAEQAYRRALSIRHDWPEALGNMGIVLRDLDRYAEAQSFLRRALVLAPHDAGAHNNLGVLLWKLNRHPEAAAQYREALRLRPGYATAHNNLGLLQLDLGRLAQAEAAFRQVLAADDRLPEAHNNLGNALKQQGRTDEAIAAYRQALALRPDYTAAISNLAMQLLHVGAYEQGWKLYESRLDTAPGRHGIAAPPVAWPRWNGESLAGKSLLVWPEQGYGDSLQFCRYLTLLKARGVARLSVACQSALQRLFAGIEGVDAVYPLDDDLRMAEHDYWCFMMSLPLHFGTTVATIPAPMPYLHAPVELVRAWRDRLPTGGVRVGLVWAGDAREHTPAWHSIDKRRSMSAQLLLPLLDIESVSFVSLQKGATTRPQIEDLPPGLRPFDPMDEVGDFADTAAIIDGLDLVITVDTSIAHLTGALNKPVWILSRYDACWRWLRDRQDSPWYPTARLFRQPAPGEWGDVIEQVAKALAAFARSRSC